MEVKQCAKCKELKSLTEFNKHSENKDGLQAYCRPCSVLSMRNVKRAAPTEEWLRKRDARRRYRRLNREKHKAHRTIYRVVSKGLMTRKPCEVCGTTKSEAHHPDYSKPYDVQWLCRTHHQQIHRKAA